MLGLFPRRHTGDAFLPGRGLAVEIPSRSVSDGLNRIVFMKHYPDSWLPAMFGVLLLPSIGACQRVKPLGSDEIRVSGTIELTPVGVNCWRLTDKDGNNYELRADQAPTGLLTNGKAVTLVLKLRSDLMSACQVGQIADVVRVE